MIQDEYEEAAALLEKIPEHYIDRVAKFLDSIEMKKEAYEIVRDMDFKFDLALQLGMLDEAFEIIQSIDSSESKWKQIGDVCLIDGRVDLAIQSYQKVEDLPSLFLIYSSLGMKDELAGIAKKARDATRFDIAFKAYFLLVIFFPYLG